MNEVRWGIVGTGKIANKFAQAVVRADGAKLVAVASRKMETAREFAAKYDIETCFGSYEDMAASDMVDAVYIALPHRYHAETSIQFLKSGKHVLCEKPIAVNVKELTQVLEVAQENNRFIMEAMWTRFLPIMAEIKKVIDAGTIGQVREVSADFCYSLQDRTRHVFDSSCAGGSLLDVGIYGLTFACMFLGEDIAQIQTAAEVNNNVDERLNVLLTYKNGDIARVSSALTLMKPAYGYIYGTGGYIYVPGFYGAKEFEVSISGVREKYEVPFKGNGFEEEIEECCRCILAGKTASDIMSPERSRFVLGLMDQIRKQIGVVYSVD